MATNIGTIEGKIVLKDDFTKTLDNIGKSIGRTASSMRSAGTQMTMAITAPITLITGAVTAMGATFESEMLKINTLVGVNQEKVNKWSKDILAMAPKVGKGPHELAKALFVVTSAGIRTGKALEIVEQAGQAAAIGLGETQTIARAVTAAMQAYGEENLSATRATEILVATVREGNLEASSLAGSLGRVIGIASQVGVSFEEVGGFVATFTRLGVSAEESVTALRGVMNTLLKPTQESEEALAAVGLSAAKLRESVGSQGLTKTMLMLVDTFRGQEHQMAKVIPNVRALAGVMGTAAAQGDAYLGITKEINESHGILAEGFETLQDDVQFQFEQIVAELKTIGTEFGRQLLPVIKDSLIPAIKDLLGLLGDLADWFGNLSDESKLLTMSIVGLAAAIGPILLTVGGLLGVLPLVASGWAMVAGALGGVTAAATTTTANIATLGATSITTTTVTGGLTVALGALKTALIAVSWVLAPLITLWASWKFGKWISEATGLNKALQGIADNFLLIRRNAQGVPFGKMTADQLKLIEHAEEKLGKEFSKTHQGWQDAMFALDEQRRKIPEVAEAYEELNGKLEKTGANYEGVADEMARYIPFLQKEFDLNTKIGLQAKETNRARVTAGDRKWLPSSAGPLGAGATAGFGAPGAFQASKGFEDVTGRFGKSLLDARVGVQAVADETEDIVEETTSWADMLDQVNNAMQALGISADSTFGQILGGMTAAASGAETFAAGIQKGGVSGMMQAGVGVMQGAGAIASATSSGSRGARVGKGALAGASFGGQIGGPIGAAVGGAVGAIVGALRGRKTLSIMEDAGRDMGQKVSEGLAKEIADSGKNMQAFVAEIFEEGFASGDPAATADRLAEEIGDIFSAVEQGLLTESEGAASIEAAIPLLIEHFGELGAAGEEQVQRIIAAAQEFGLEIENLGELIGVWLTEEKLEELGLAGERNIQKIRDKADELGITFEELYEKIQGTFAPDTLEEIMEKFRLTNEEARALADKLGIDVQTNLERMAGSLGLSVDEFKALGEAVEKEFGIPMENIEELLASLGISAADLAAKLGVEVGEGAGEVESAQEKANEELAEGARLAGEMAGQLERAARASGGIHVNTDGDMPGFAEGAVVNRPTPAVFGEAGPEVAVPVAALFGELGSKMAQEVAAKVGGSGGGGNNFDFRGAIVVDHEQLMAMIGEGIRDNVGNSATLAAEGQERIA